METSKEYYDKVMSDYRSRGARRSLRKYCLDEGVDYQWLLKAQKEYSRTAQPSGTSSHFIPLSVEGRNAAEKSSETDKAQRPEEWRIQRMVLAGPHGEIEISGGSMPALLSLMANLGQEGE